TDGSWQNLTNDDIVKGAVVVTNSAENVELTEGVDYEIDYTSGKIRRLIRSGSGGTASGTGAGAGSVVTTIPVALAVQNIVTVHYEYFVAKVKDYDYSINYERGSIARKDGGSLVSGTKIYMDYKVSELIADEAAFLSIDQAHVWIINRIGEEYEGSIDDNLKYGESYLALFLISKMSAANLIYEKRNDDIEEAAKELKLISEDYRNMALSFLQDYFKFPSLQGGVRIRKN
ncbi:unnamed protein product, partial [marine sediment metagenome]